MLSGIHDYNFLLTTNQVPFIAQSIESEQDNKYKTECK